MCFIFFRHLGLLAHPLTGYGCPGRGPQNGIEMSPVGISGFCHAIPCKSHFSTAQLGERLKNERYLFEDINNMWCFMWCLIMVDHHLPHIFPWTNGRWTGDFSSSVFRSTGCIPEPVPELEELSWTWPSATSGWEGASNSMKISMGKYMGKSSIYGIYIYILYMGKYMGKSSIYGI